MIILHVIRRCCVYDHLNISFFLRGDDGKFYAFLLWNLIHLIILDGC